MSFVSTAAVAGVYELTVNPTPAFTTASSTPSAVDAPLLDRLRNTRVFAVTEVLATAFVPRTRVVWPMRALAPDLIEIPLPAVPRVRLPLVMARVPVVRVSPAVPLGVKVNPTAAFVPVPVKTFPEARLIAVAAVVVLNVAALTVANEPVVVPNDTHVATPAATRAKPNQVPATVLTHC